jgi:hypothetical protein
MTYKQFLLEVQQAGMSVNESSGTYYWNLWCDTMKHAPTYNFKAFLAWMKKHYE